METIITSFLLVFFAEIGDKTQFLSIIFATRYKLYQVLLGVFIGVMLNHGIAVGLAFFLSSIINIQILKIVAALMFLIFGIESFTIREESEDEEDIRKNFSAVITVAVCFFIGELGDKTQITAMSLVFTGKNPIYTLIGTTSAMLCVSFLGIIIGKLLKGKIDKDNLKKISGLIFIFFGLRALYYSIPENYLNMSNIIIFLIFFFLIVVFIYKKNKQKFLKIWLGR